METVCRITGLELSIQVEEKDGQTIWLLLHVICLSLFKVYPIGFNNSPFLDYVKLPYLAVTGEARTCAILTEQDHCARAASAAALVGAMLTMTKVSPYSEERLR